MSLYHEAAQILSSTKIEHTSIKSLVYSKKVGRSEPKALFALSTEAAKWSEVLSEVLERSGVLKIDRQLSPTLALVLTHDLFLSKRGIALPSSHGLNVTISKHKARLSAELTKARLRRGFATVDALRASINSGSSSLPNGDDVQPRLPRHPRWVRINTLKTTLDDQLSSTFAEYRLVKTLLEVTQPSLTATKVYRIDEHVPNLIAIPSGLDITTSKAYRTGQLILQDKASCFPAYLLSPHASEGDVIDACAAPGNKTTHLAAILHDIARSHGDQPGNVVACEKDATRSQTLQKMIKLAGAAEIVEVKAKQDFTKLNPDGRASANVTALLLDPSCSGSGMVGRDEGSGITVYLPSSTTTSLEVSNTRGKKRKRTSPAAKYTTKPIAVPPATEALHDEEELPTDESAEKLRARLANLSAFQLRLLRHAMAFLSARRIAYSTCSIHAEENEYVVVNALLSPIARERGWRVGRRSEQVEGLRKWHLRGQRKAVESALEAQGGEGGEGFDVDDVADACIRCDKHGEDGTMGFFVVGFVRDIDGKDGGTNGTTVEVQSTRTPEEDEHEWNGFDDET